MKTLQRAVRSVRNQGLGITLFKLYMIVQDRWFDMRYGLDTCAWSKMESLTTDGANKRRVGNDYQPSRVLPIMKMLQAIKKIGPPNAALVDFGSGKGRVLFLAAASGFRKVRGVEFAHELCDISRRNWEAFRGRTDTEAEVLIVEGDAAKYVVRDDESVFFLFNPFDGNVLSRVLDNIVESLRQRPRKVLIVYYLPDWGRVIEARSEFERVLELNYWGYCFTIFSNRD